MFNVTRLFCLFSVEMSTAYGDLRCLTALCQWCDPHLGKANLPINCHGPNDSQWIPRSHWGEKEKENKSNYSIKKSYTASISMENHFKLTPIAFPERQFHSRSHLDIWQTNTATAADITNIILHVARISHVIVVVAETTAAQPILLMLFLLLKLLKFELPLLPSYHWHLNCDFEYLQKRNDWYLKIFPHFPPERLNGDTFSGSQYFILLILVCDFLLQQKLLTTPHCRPRRKQHCRQSAMFVAVAVAGSFQFIYDHEIESINSTILYRTKVTFTIWPAYTLVSLVSALFRRQHSSDINPFAKLSGRSQSLLVTRAIAAPMAPIQTTANT